MRHSIARDLYKQKYQSELSQDQYYGMLKAGLNLLNETDMSRESDPVKAQAINIALDYKLGVLLSGHGRHNGIIDAEYYDLGC